MEGKQITYYLWSDIQTEICTIMNIKKDDFTTYNNVVGGKYKNLWHEWLEYFESEVKNDIILNNGGVSESLESKLEWIKEDEKDWLEPFVRAVYDVFDKYDIKYIKYSW